MSSSRTDLAEIECNIHQYVSISVKSHHHNPFNPTRFTFKVSSFSMWLVSGPNRCSSAGHSAQRGPRGRRADALPLPERGVGHRQAHPHGGSPIHCVRQVRSLPTTLASCSPCRTPERDLAPWCHQWHGRCCLIDVRVVTQ